MNDKRLNGYAFILPLALVVLMGAIGGIAPSYAVGVDLNGRWESSYSGKIIEVRQTGNAVVGGDSFRGTLSGNEFSGEIFLTADGCPNLEGFATATGVVSADQNTIALTTDKAFHFLTKECTKTGEEYADSTSYTRIRDESPPTPTTPASPAEEKYRPIEDALNAEIGVSPDIRQTTEPDKARDYFAPDPGYGGLDREVVFGLPSPIGDSLTIPGRGRGEYDNLSRQIGRIGDFHGRVTVEYQLPDGTSERVQVRRIGTSIRPAVILPGTKVYLGDGASIDFWESNGARNLYEAEGGASVRRTMLEPPPEPPSHLLPAPVRDLIRRAIDYFYPTDPDFNIPYGITGVKG